MSETGSIVGKQQYLRGVKIVELPDGTIDFTYVDNPRYVFASPIVEQRHFTTWSEVINFLKMWTILDKIKWW